MLVICFGHKYIHSRSAIGCGVSNVSFIPFSFLVFGILHNICLPFARQDGKTPERKSHNLSDQNTKNQKTKIWDEKKQELQIVYRFPTLHNF